MALMDSGLCLSSLRDFFFLSLYAFPQKGALGYEAAGLRDGTLALIKYPCITSLSKLRPPPSPQQGIQRGHK